ncbi:DUF2975 domain-containing protein [Bifidobacterium sp. ESL0763]|uniref:DUF2975 domain-containing protein n=1 Tax=Bifidobacterium sp. ESL0763 TaxID=2983227 RepID=UPI0023F84FA4|nr:DUF2975 domain-containing protein [Bifidobacterium sp. ESL0763]MDF7663946.1 DUF2975 domain-containing protein [Bifidobacterium sp. ESL0763]
MELQHHHGPDRDRTLPNTPGGSGRDGGRRRAHIPHHTLAILLEATDACVVAICLALPLIVIPAAERAGELKRGSALLAALGMLPLAVVAVCAWRLFSAIGREETFTSGNVRRLRTIGVAFAVSAVVWLAELVVVLAATADSRRLVPLGLAMAFVFCLVLAVVSSALASLTAAATELKTDNDLVI